MKPQLFSIEVVKIEEATTTISVKYAAQTITGIEIMGVDAGLSWIKGESIKLTKLENGYFHTELILEDTCEFRARSYKDEEEFWEDGKRNHSLRRLENGRIEINTDLPFSEFHFRSYPPLIFDEEIERIENNITNPLETNVHLFQFLIDLSFWLQNVFENVEQENKWSLVPNIIKFIKIETRTLNSKLVDDVCRPPMIALFHMYESLLQHDEESPYEELIEFWKSKDYINEFIDMPDKIKSLENEKFGIGSDVLNRFKELLTYN
ncbi:MAG: hypothetical protein OEZ01_02210 [Candidatus Heimdallarchaeota archaeon]|nr:hypothetical protein [Candidatus Heimdallarchaeota archaeon]MDH5644789.1 hypothetical protein [Candidatus Heimdallarchaeota archaeon]